MWPSKGCSSLRRWTPACLIVCASVTLHLGACLGGGRAADCESNLEDFDLPNWDFCLRVRATGVHAIMVHARVSR